MRVMLIKPLPKNSELYKAYSVFNEAFSVGSIFNTLPGRATSPYTLDITNTPLGQGDISADFVVTSPELEECFREIDTN